MATVVARDSRPGLRRRFSAALYRRPGLKLVFLLLPPLAWMVVVYLGSLSLLFVSSFWRVDPFTSAIVHRWGLDNFKTILTEPAFRATAVRTAGIAAAVTVTDVLLAFPIAYYAARLATPRVRNALLVAVVLPLWSNYLVRVFAWRTILAEGGLADSFLGLIGLPGVRLGFTNWAVWIAFCYLWLPFVILPIYVALERIPRSLLEASGDLGARPWTTFRDVVFPLAFPGVVAGSIFAFSLTLGDYITPSLVGNTRFIGNVIFEFVGVSGNVPIAAAYGLVPVAIMAVYLFVARRLRAFEAL